MHVTEAPGPQHAVNAASPPSRSWIDPATAEAHHAPNTIRDVPMPRAAAPRRRRSTRWTHRLMMFSLKLLLLQFAYRRFFRPHRHDGQGRG